MPEHNRQAQRRRGSGEAVPAPHIFPCAHGNNPTSAADVPALPAIPGSVFPAPQCSPLHPGFSVPAVSAFLPAADREAGTVLQTHSFSAHAPVPSSLLSCRSRQDTFHPGRQTRSVSCTETGFHFPPRGTIELPSPCTEPGVSPQRNRIVLSPDGSSVHPASSTAASPQSEVSFSGRLSAVSESPDPAGSRCLPSWNIRNGSPPHGRKCSLPEEAFPPGNGASASSPAHTGQGFPAPDPPDAFSSEMRFSPRQCPSSGMPLSPPAPGRFPPSPAPADVPARFCGVSSARRY